MNYLSKKLTAYILRKGLISQENTDAYEYGFLYLLEVLVSLFCSIIIAVFLNAEVECLLFFLFFIPLRSYSGGFHTNHYISCLILSCCLLFSGLFLVKHVTISPIISISLILISIGLLKLIGPVDHPDREVESSENDIFIKKSNITYLLSIAIACLFFIFKMPVFLFLEAIVFVLVTVLSFLGRLKYHNL